jgi:translation elongation factor EF-1alpha
MADKAIGKVTHYYDRVGVAVISLGKGGSLKKGDKIKIKSGEDEFTQTIKSLQLDHQDVESVKAGDDFGLKVDKKVHEGNQIFGA